MESLKQTMTWSGLLVVGTLFVGCAMPMEGDMDEEENVDGVGSIAQASTLSTNGLRTINGLTTTNGLTAVNGLRTLNGLRTMNGLSETIGLMTTSAGRDTVAYVVRCALSASQSITKKDQKGVSYTFTGQIGVAPEWADGACNIDCQESVSACVLAHVNTTGQHIGLWMDGNAKNVGWGQSTSHPFQEGSFFGNIFIDSPRAYFCNGKDFDRGVVPGRIGATQTGAPYKNPYSDGGWPGAGCNVLCTEQDIPNDKDGYKACAGFNHVITVWRNFDPNTAYKICNKGSQKCLDSGGSTVSGASVVQKSYTSAASQKWNIVQINPRQYKLVNVSSGKVLDIYQQKISDGTAIIQSTYSGASNQLWNIGSMGDLTGFYKINTILNANVAVSVPSSALTVEGKPLVEWTWNNTDPLKWTILPAN